MREVKGWVVNVFFFSLEELTELGSVITKYFSDTSTNYCTAQQGEKVNCHTGHLMRNFCECLNTRPFKENNGAHFFYLQ